MFSPIKHCLALLLVLPIAAVANPVSVTTHSTGLVDPNPAVLGRLGIETPGSILPYDLTVRSVFDPDSAGYLNLGDFAIQDEGDLDISLKLGSKAYHFAGQGWSNVRTYKVDDATDGYEHDITFSPPETVGFDVSIWNRMIAPAGTFTGQPVLATRRSPFTPLDAFTDFVATPSNPDAPGLWTMIGTVKTFSLQVSPVPEPATLGMLAAGVLALGLRRRRT